jgi:phage baseplate assembly protein gpV
VSYVPPRPPRRCVQTTLTATVVGPSGVEIHVDTMGQIKVQFPWDREGTFDDGSSCWIRTMQPWGGAGWGVQFLPRVGMEVIVSFLDGDPDKPIVLGSVYNATHPSPFLLPGDKTRSGWKTQSSPGGGGNNELSFQDAAGKEQIYLHAQRNLDELVEKNHTLRVMSDKFLRILGNRIDRIEQNLDEIVKGDHTSRVEGNRIDVVTGNRDDRVSGTLVTRVEQKERRQVRGTADLEYADDITTRVKGSMTTLVGTQDKKRSWVTHAEGKAKLSSLDSTEVSSEGELVLRVGKSSIRIKDGQIEISSPSISATGGGGSLSASDDGLKLSSKADAQLIVKGKLVLKTDGASLSMQQQVKVDGSQILLNSPDQATDPPPKDPDPPTTVMLKDQDGTALVQQRFLIKLDDGSDLTGMTDQEGSAVLDLARGGTITFPDANSKQAPGAMKPYVIRQGDYLKKLAHTLGFDADAVWNHAKNADMAKQRQPNLLHPGDILYVPDPTLKWETLSKGTTNSYVVTVPKTTLTLSFKDAKGPMANAAYVVEGLGEKLEGTTDGNGVATLAVPVHIVECRVTFPDLDETFPVRVGHMDPIDEASGVRKRLLHLGYYPIWIDSNDTDALDKQGLCAFQDAKGLPATGILDDATKAALSKEHGS